MRNFIIRILQHVIMTMSRTCSTYNGDVYKILERKDEGKILIVRQLPKNPAPCSAKGLIQDTISTHCCIQTLGLTLWCHSGNELLQDHVYFKQKHNFRVNFEVFVILLVTIFRDSIYEYHVHASCFSAYVSSSRKQAGL